MGQHHIACAAPVVALALTPLGSSPGAHSPRQNPAPQSPESVFPLRSWVLKTRE